MFRSAAGRNFAAALVPAGAGVIAGILATAVQVLLWWLSSVPVLATLLRDARLTAAIAMGPAVLDRPMAWDVLLWATLIHFTLSIAYGFVLAHLVRGLSGRLNVAVSALFGLALYFVNLHGFTALFPWFVAARGWITALTHVAFGILLGGSYALLRARLARTHADAGP